MSRRFTSLGDPGFGQLFESFSYTAFRLETLQAYDVTYEGEDFGRFLRGEPRSESPGIEPWVRQVARGTEIGKRFQRVHVVLEPLTDYIRFECAWSYRDTVAAGEDVRIISATAESWPDGIPHLDYWLFDSSQLVRMIYNLEGEFTYAELVDDPAEIMRANLWRDRAVYLSRPFRQFDDGFDAFMNRDR